MLAYQIGSYHYQIANEPLKANSVNQEALRFLSGKSKVMPAQRFKILKDILITNLKMKKWQDVLGTLKNIEAMGLSYNHNFFNLQAVKFQVYAYRAEYDKLYELTHEIMNIKELKKIVLKHEQWKVKEAFVHFLVEAGKINPRLLEKKKLKPFRIKRFMNDIVIQAQDKRGSNITARILQLLFMLVHKKYDKVQDSLDALTQYTHRYLRNDETLRSNCFIKMCLKLPDADFNPIRTQRYVNKYWKKLIDNPLEISLQSSEVEVIPYEQLWEMVIEIISRKK